ncbi:MAG: alpha/beta hydrolase [Deltaproteobacteria bacterium]|jgi:pimeloyl-ACP methyl ester carboxylesterase|nr:alpha/beta hydrolase [Deltaproteobacteria bacterium]
MTDFEKGLRLYDHPEITRRLLFPRREFIADSTNPRTFNHFIEVEPGVEIGCRFYPFGEEAPNIIYFHGNGEIASDYDFVAPMYRELGLNLFVTDYRGYGMSSGDPTPGAMIRDAHPLFRGFSGFLSERRFTGRHYVMGRSLGSAPAIEIAYRHSKQLAGLIVESGFASARNQLRRIGMTHLLEDDLEPVGFGNDIKIGAIKIPTLIIHGEEDEIIPVGEGRSLYELSGAPLKRVCFIPRAGHNDLLIGGLKRYMDAVDTFISAT